MSRKFNPNLAKIHRSYTVGEVSLLFNVHKNTVRAWIKKGLLTNDDQRPTLILGQHLRLFLQARKTENKRKCLSYEIYCLKCRSPKVPAENMADYEAINDRTGRLIGFCPECKNIINKYIRLDQINAIRLKLDIIFPEATKTHNQEA